jgi:hypothetical protein
MANKKSYLNACNFDIAMLESAMRNGESLMFHDDIISEVQAKEIVEDLQNEIKHIEQDPNYTPWEEAEKDLQLYLNEREDY